MMNNSSSDHEGVHVLLEAQLANVHISLQIDVGFGGAIVPSHRNWSSRRSSSFQLQTTRSFRSYRVDPMKKPLSRHCIAYGVLSL